MLAHRAFTAALPAGNGSAVWLAAVRSPSAVVGVVDRASDELALGRAVGSVVALSQYDIAISIPLPQLLAFTVVAILAGVGAAIVPARHASRLNVLDALHYE